MKFNFNVRITCQEIGKEVTLDLRHQPAEVLRELRIGSDWRLRVTIDEVCRLRGLAVPVHQP